VLDIIDHHCWRSLVQKHLLTLRYHGLLADQGVMNISHAGHVQGGVRRLLSANAYFVLYGDVPVRLYGQTDSFMVVELPATQGSFIREFAVILTTSLATDALNNIVSDGLNVQNTIIFAIGTAATALLKQDELMTKIGKLLQRRSPELPPRIEPVLALPNEPVIALPYEKVSDLKIADEQQVDEFTPEGAQDPQAALVARTLQGLKGIAKRVEQNTAARVDISLDGKYLLSTEKESPPLENPMDAVIADALAELRLLSR
jgi:hypothetical protein